MRHWIVAFAAGLLTLGGYPALAQNVPVGVTVAADGNCPAGTVVNPGSGRAVYGTSKGAECVAISGTITANNASVGATGATAPTSATLVGATNGGNLVG